MKKITILLFVILSKITFAQINTTSFAAKVDYASGVGTSSNPVGVIAADLDNDGKNDIVVGNQGVASISVFANTSTLNNITLATKVDYVTSNIVTFLRIIDLDGDGKLDIILCSASGNNISVFQNTTTIVGSISFATRQDYTCASGYYNIDVDDVDGDLKPDLVVINTVAGTFSVFRNTSANGTISLATRVDQSCNTDPSSVVIFDMDGDGKKDIVITNYISAQISIYKNTTPSFGSPTFSFLTTINTGSNPHFIKCADLNNDGKLDLVTGNFYGNNISVIKNTSTLGNISFQSSINISSGTGTSYCQGISLSDFDNDNRIDIGVCNRGNDNISVFKNTSISGTFNSTSFAPQVFFSVNTAPNNLFASDLDGDGKLDIIVSNNGSNNISVLKNQFVPIIAPTNLKYSDSVVIATRTITNLNNTVTYSGDLITNFSISPNLPTGVNLNTVTGKISGIPIGNLPQTAYTITGTNDGGSTTASFKLTVNRIAPSNLKYNDSIVVAMRTITNLNSTPTNTGDGITSYSITPSLPTGVSLNTLTGKISGIPTVILTPTIYTITGTNNGGSTTASFKLTVNKLAPSNLKYNDSIVIATRTITNLNSNATYNGDSIDNFSITPSLPTGLSLNSTTGIISGIPTLILPPTVFTITGTNNGGSTTASFRLSVNRIAPSNLKYNDSIVIATRTITNINSSVTYSGDSISSFGITPSLPTGVSLNTTTGTISGIPTATLPPTVFTVVGINNGGITTASFILTVKKIAPSNLKYNDSIVVATKTITNINS
jgi:hypothetical protein